MQCNNVINAIIRIWMGGGGIRPEKYDKNCKKPVLTQGS